MVAEFTVFFKDPFWVGVLESRDEDGLAVARQVFGAEPSNAELLEFMLFRYSDMRRSRPSPAGAASEACRPVNPKRSQRLAARAVARPPSTKAQAALAASREADKAERAAISREARRAEAERRFALRREKRKQRRAGR